MSADVLVPLKCFAIIIQIRCKFCFTVIRFLAVMLFFFLLIQQHVMYEQLQNNVEFELWWKIVSYSVPSQNQARQWKLVLYK